MILLLDLTRSVLIFFHLLLFAFALSTVINSDIRAFRGELDSDSIASTGRTALRLFIGLWITGLLVIFMDTGFNPTVLSEKPKLLIKLVCVFTLTLNATLLHLVCSDILGSQTPLTKGNAKILSISGALSNSHWLMATFVGSANMLSNFAFKELFNFYCIVCLLVLCLAVLIAPYLQNRLNVQRADRMIRSIGLRTHKSTTIEKYNRPERPIAFSAST